MNGVQQQATDAVARADRLTNLRERHRASVQATTRGVANRLVDVIFEQPVLNTWVVEARLGVSRPAALNALRQLEDLGVLVRTTEGRRGQLRWLAHEVLAILTDETVL